MAAILKVVRLNNFRAAHCIIEPTQFRVHPYKLKELRKGFSKWGFNEVSWGCPGAVCGAVWVAVCGAVVGTTWGCFG